MIDTRAIAIPVALIVVASAIIMHTMPDADAKPTTASVIVPSWPPAPEKFEKEGNATYVTVTLGVHAEDPGGLWGLFIYTSKSEPVNLTTGQVDHTETNKSRLRIENSWTRTEVPISDGKNVRTQMISHTVCNCAEKYANLPGGYGPCGLFCGDVWEINVTVSGDFFVEKRLQWDEIKSTAGGFRYFFTFGDYGEICATAPPMPQTVFSKTTGVTNATEQELAAAAKLPPDGAPAEEPILTHVPIDSMKTNETANLTATVKSKPPCKAELFYTSVGETTFTSVSMASIDSSGDITTFRGTIPAQKKPGQLRYYIKASNSTRTETSPPNAPTVFHEVIVGEDLRIVASYPRLGDINLPADLSTTVMPAATITFSEDLYTGYVSEKTFKMYYLDKIGFRYDIPCKVDYYTKNFTVQMTPAQKLPEGTQINISISGLVCNRGVKSTLGTERVISFTTMPKISVTMQAIQVSEDVDLIEQKPAVVRVFAQWPSPQDSTVKMVGSSVVLSVDGKEAGNIARKDFQPSRYLKPAAIWRGDCCANFFYPDFVNYPGRHTLSVTVTPLVQHTAQKATFTCETAVIVRELYTGLRTRSWQYETFFAPLGVGDYKTLFWASLPRNIVSDANRQNAFLNDVFPVGRAVPTIQNTVVAEPLMASGYTNAGFTDTDGYFGTLFFALHKAALFDTYSREVYLVPQGWLVSKYSAAGLSNSNFWRVVLVETGALGPITAHEILHTYGYENHDDSVTDIEGFDVKGKRVKSCTEYPANLNNLFQEIPDTEDFSWISTAQYKGMMDRFSVAPGRSGDGDRSLLISGCVGKTTTFFPFYELDVPPDYSGLKPGNLTVLLLDGSNHTLASYNVTPYRIADRDYFAFSAARPVGLSSVVLKEKGVEVARAARSKSVPAVSVSGPSGTVSGPFEIRWNGSDGDGDNLIYSLLFSSDGVNWKALLTDTSSTNYTVQPAGLTGGRLFFRVAATDGFNTAFADLPPLGIANRPPAVEIRTPRSSDIAEGYLIGDTLPLSALAYDLEDGTLDGSRVIWKSSIQGELGKGPSLATNLTMGTHRITVTATDSGGLSSNATINITIRDETGQSVTPAENYWVVASAAEEYTTTGEVTISWFGNFPRSGAIAIYKKGTGYWEKIGKLDGFARTQCIITGLSKNDSIDYEFAVGILDEDGNRLNLSEPIRVSTYANTTTPPTPPKPPPPPGGFIPVSPLALPAALLAATVLFIALRRRRSAGDNR